MPANVITPEDLQIFKKELLEDIRKLLMQKETHELKRWLRGTEVRKLLSISTGTLYTLRQNGSLPFTRIGQINYYDYDDIKRILEDNKQCDFDSVIKLKHDEENRNKKINRKQL